MSDHDAADAPRAAVDADDAILGATSADDVEASKPAPRPALQALEQAGDSPFSAR
ncbi:hypothetical protein GCM10020000_73290 [Streptomyces olivoverticillatus]